MKDFVRTWFPTAADYPASRLFSLDVLRGLDMLLLTVVGPLVRALQGAFACFPASFMGQFSHGWVCFTLWDIIMPLFIFMCGAAMPFALGRRLREGRGVFWRRVLSRVALLWAMGGLVQGNWVEFNPGTFSPFANTLQSIAVGYLATAALMAVPSRALSVAAPFACAFVYTALLAWGGDYTKTGNFAFKIDHAILSALLPADNPYVAKPSHYTWFLTSLMFAAMTMCGYQAAMLLRTAWTKRVKALALFGYAAGLFALGGIASIWIPVIKPIYTLSFTALAMGWCVLALAVLYVVCDIFLFRRGTALVLLFGQGALAAYFVSHFFRAPLRSVAETVLKGVIRLVDKDTAGFLVALAVAVELVAVVALWRAFKAMRAGTGRGDAALRHACTKQDL